MSPLSLGDVMTLPQEQAPDSVIPDLREIPLERLAELNDSVLAQSLALYRQRLGENGLLLSLFNSVI
jgi:FXSXX-COOH protein